MTEKFVTLPRDVVEHVMHHLNRGDDDAVCWADGVIKPALEQSQRKLTAQDIADSALLGNIESLFNACMHQEHCKRWKEQAQNHVPEAGNMVTAGWKLVPVEPTHEIISAMLESEAQDDEGKFPTLFDLIDFSGANKALMVVAAAYRAMLDAAPQLPVVEQPQAVTNCHQSKQPQVEQEPVAVLAFYEGVREPRLLSWNRLPNGEHRLYTRPHSQCEPLTVEAKAVIDAARATWTTCWRA